MAFDETLLRSYAASLSGPTFRVYGWKDAAVSLGYSQDPAECLEVVKTRTPSMAFVRRITGGGIIVHGDELTYSMAFSKKDLAIPERVVSSYKTISSFLITFYKMLDIDAAFACDVSGPERLGVPSALCFASKEKYDIVSGTKKIGGSAQKRSGGLVFQHGSIPISIRAEGSLPAVSGATSISELLGESRDAKELRCLLVEAFRTTFNLDAEYGCLSDTEEEMFHMLKTRKYESDAWNYRRVDLSYYSRETCPSESGERGIYY